MSNVKSDLFPSPYPSSPRLRVSLSPRLRVSASGFLGEQSADAILLSRFSAFSILYECYPSMPDCVVCSNEVLQRTHKDELAIPLTFPDTLIGESNERSCVA